MHTPPCRSALSRLRSTGRAFELERQLSVRAYKMSRVRLGGAKMPLALSAMRSWRALALRRVAPRPDSGLVLAYSG